MRWQTANGQVKNDIDSVGTPTDRAKRTPSFLQAGTPGDAETDLKQYEAAPYFSETNNLIIADELIINTDMPKKMSEEDPLRDFIREAGDCSGMTETICTAISEQYYYFLV